MILNKQEFVYNKPDYLIYSSAFMDKFFIERRAFLDFPIQDEIWLNTFLHNCPQK